MEGGRTPGAVNRHTKPAKTELELGVVAATIKLITGEKGVQGQYGMFEEQLDGERKKAAAKKTRIVGWSAERR